MLIETLLLLTAAMAQQPANFEVAGDWAVRVTVPGRDSHVVRVTPPVMLTVTAEKYERVPMFNPKVGGWAKGEKLRGVKTMETTNAHLLEESSLVLRAGPEPDAAVLTRGVDYEADLAWGSFGLVAGSRVKPDQPVYASYRYSLTRLDAVVLSPDGSVTVRQGEPRAAAPVVPTVRAGERHLGNIYLPGFVAKLEADHLFPVLETAYPEQAIAKNATVKRVIAKLESGRPVRILAWGDSVTDGAYLTKPERWQEQFVERLRVRFPKAQVELLTQAWGGRNTSTYLKEPAGSVHNYKETVLGVKPDVVISEFVNDAGLNPAQVEERYGKLLADFEEIGADWIILTPHFVRPDWMALTREREVDDDPRPYVAGLRQFAAKHDVALADASLRYGRLWRQGIPYNTLMLNAINHPNALGMRLFADALMALFR